MKRIFIPDPDQFPSSSEAVVIGGGIVGVATAFWLSQAGLETTLLEMRDGLSTLTTPNSVECFRKQFTEPAMAELAADSIQIFEDFPRVTGLADYDIGLTHQGYLFYSDNPERVDSLQEAVRTHRELGIEDSEFLDRAALLERFPFLADSVQGATFRQQDGWLSSHELTQGFARGSSARFLLQTRATGIETDSKGVAGVQTDRGRISTRLVINAAGPFAGEVGRLAGIELPLRPVRRQKAYLSPHPAIPQDAPMTIDVEREVYFRPETGGALIGWVDPDEPESAPSETLPVDRYFAAQTMALLAETVPFMADVAEGLKSSQVITSAGQYVYTPDDQPLIGEWPDLPGFYLNCGYWAGVMLAPAAGRRIANLITGEVHPQDNPLRPSRYQEGQSLEGSSFLRGRH